MTPTLKYINPHMYGAPYDNQNSATILRVRLWVILESVSNIFNT